MTASMASIIAKSKNDEYAIAVPKKEAMPLNPDNTYPITVQCPWCEKGETLADRTADIRISCQCSKCSNFYHVDFATMRVEKARANRRKQPKTVKSKTKE